MRVFSLIHDAKERAHAGSTRAHRSMKHSLAD